MSGFPFNPTDDSHLRPFGKGRGQAVSFILQLPEERGGTTTRARGEDKRRWSEEGKGGGKETEADRELQVKDGESREGAKGGQGEGRGGETDTRRGRV